jgi:uncharacterized OB-fold protein
MTMTRIEIARARPYPPRVTEFTARFWDDLASGILTTTRCTACGEATFPPKPVCPYCWGGEVEWTRLSPRGLLYSWTRVHAGPAIFDPELPYDLGVVDLEDGVRIACRLSGGNGDWQCGAPMELAVLAYTDGPLLTATSVPPKINR